MNGEGEGEGVEIAEMRHRADDSPIIEGRINVTS